MADITHPEHFRRLARCIDGILEDLPRPGDLRQGADITPALLSVISGVSGLMTEIGEEVSTSYRHEIYDRAAHGPTERHGTALLAKGTPPLGSALAQLGHLTDRLGSLYQQVLQPVGGTRIPALPGELSILLNHLDAARSALSEAAGCMRDSVAQTSRTGRSAAPPTSSVPQMPSPGRHLLR